MKNKAEAEKKLRHTVELFRKALEKAGVGYAHDELTRMNEKNVQVSEENGSEGVDEDRKVRYNRNVPRGNDFVTQAMIWARSDGTEIGEQKTLTNGERTVVIEKTKTVTLWLNRCIIVM